MNFYLLLQSALRSLSKHKTRSLLTTLGIIIGIISIISVMSIGEGAKFRVNKEIQGLGTNFIIILSGEPKHRAMGPGMSTSLKDKDFRAIMDECEDIYQASPAIMRIAKVVRENQNWKTTIAGVDSNYLDIRQWPLAEGDFFSPQDMRSGNKVAVLGKTVRKELFGTEEVLGKTIRIKGLPFKVVGVLTEKGKMPNGMDQDDAILAPFSTVQRKIAGIHGMGAIIISVATSDKMDKTTQQIRSVLRQTRKLQPDDDDDFTLFSQNDVAQAADAATKVLNMLLMIIASISLLVGGIGIMNIMLVTVTERTKEIGIRMALGATTYKILTQFILEAIIICLFGGLIGLACGIVLSKVVGITLGWPVVISAKPVILSLSSSILVGLFFGYYPAYKASRLNPVEALIER
ncbi:TPA: multidrug ABC transporter substrate-binding protein [Candidatus Dependentiae bacterium]|nr:MAG: hypothetical protein UR14_C0002G0082 [candidate division TM6 bacterium GW2011_GWE2_31_21]KKP53879.1 MAG: hypothetical protein UR43_C0002G0082 [candidate division TM6 bacterium GW2011_GWF2_33_332]HBS47659.1 multidrug ABC transporter substrate-binding protein [Candidatus Dependentiae bacterium]HBZ73808.1 multidrug ABC transporter substrate-binding protein [Candidatus Dependentiae bacterium]